jgi:hypothetical protein
MTGLADVQIARFLAENSYHPRSSRHGDALCRMFLEDLLTSCPAFARAAEQNAIVYRANFTIDPSASDRWNADLVVGPPVAPPTAEAPRVGSIAKGNPREVWIAIDTKTIMTEHGKARRNRQRDLNSFHDILHRKNARTVVGGLLLVNMAQRFQTPLSRTIQGVTGHRNIERLVAEIVSLMEAIPMAGLQPGAGGIEGIGVIVVTHTNVAGEPTELVTTPPAPAMDHPLSYTSFLRAICAAFTARFA